MIKCSKQNVRIKILKFLPKLFKSIILLSRNNSFWFLICPFRKFLYLHICILLYPFFIYKQGQYFNALKILQKTWFAKKKEKGYLTSGDHLAGATMHDETGCCLFEACVPLKEYRHHCCEVCRF